jgi:hypothetical protein
MRLWTAAVVAVGLLSLGAAGAWADSNNLNNSGTFVIRIQPNVDVGVQVETTGTGWTSAWPGLQSLNVSMDLGAEQVLATGVKLTILGNVNNQEVELKGDDSAATWKLVGSDATSLEDKLRLAALIGKDQDVPPDTTLFDNSADDQLITTAGVPAGQATDKEGEGDENNGTKHYEMLTTAGDKYEDVDTMHVGYTRRLWLRVKTPPSSSVSDQQAITVIVTALNGKDY